MATIFDVDLQTLLGLTAVKPASTPPDKKMLRAGPRPVPMVGAPPAKPEARPESAMLDAAVMEAPALDAAAMTPVSAAEKGAYFNFIRIDVRHGFFNGNGGICEELSIEPTPQTRARLVQFGLVPRCRPDGLDLLWTNELHDQAEARLAPIRQAVAGLGGAQRAKALADISLLLFEPALLFRVRLANPRFSNFTAMPADFRIGDPPLLLSTRAVTPSGTDARAADFVVDWQTRITRPDPRPERPDADTPPPPAPSAGPPRAVARGLARAEREHLDSRSTDFALLEVHFMRADPKPPAGGAWDGLPVSLDPGPAHVFRPVAYTVAFAARETHWRYFIATREGSLPETDGLAIVEATDGSDAGFQLTGEPSILPDGRPAVCLASRDPLPILARPKRIFALKGIPSGGRRSPATLVDRLPAAGTESIAPMDPTTFPPRAGEPPPAWSDLYVFV